MIYQHRLVYRHAQRWSSLLALLLVVTLAGCARPGTSDEAAAIGGSGDYSGTVVDPPQELKNWALMSQTGKPMRLSDFQGKPTLIFFGYTNCPDVCPMTLTVWKQVREELGEQAQNVGFVFISVDSQRDRPEVLAKFTAKYDPLFIGMTGDDSTLRLIGKDYGLYWTPHKADAAPNATDVEHSPASYLIDSQSRLVKIYNYGVPATAITADIKKMLR